MHVVRGRRSATLSAILYTIPSIALLPAAWSRSPGIDRLDRRDRARLLHAADPLPQHAHRPARRARRRCSRRRAGMGLTRSQIADAGRAAARAAGDHRRHARRDGDDDQRSRRSRRSSSPQGLGAPIFERDPDDFNTEFIAAGVLAVAARARRRRRCSCSSSGCSRPWARRRGGAERLRPSTRSSSSATTPACCGDKIVEHLELGGAAIGVAHRASRCPLGVVARPPPPRLVHRDQRRRTSAARCRAWR